MREENSQYKTRLCEEWGATGGCRAGEACRLAHGLAELRSETDNQSVVTCLAKLVGKFSKAQRAPPVPPRPASAPALRPTSSSPSTSLTFSHSSSAPAPCRTPLGPPPVPFPHPTSVPPPAVYAPAVPGVDVRTYPRPREAAKVPLYPPLTGALSTFVFAGDVPAVRVGPPHRWPTAAPTPIPAHPGVAPLSTLVKGPDSPDVSPAESRARPLFLII